MAGDFLRLDAGWQKLGALDELVEVLEVVVGRWPGRRLKVGVRGFVDVEALEARASDAFVEDR